MDYDVRFVVGNSSVRACSFHNVVTFTFIIIIIIIIMFGSSFFSCDYLPFSPCLHNSNLLSIQYIYHNSFILLTFSRLMTYIYIYIYICRTAPLTSRRCILYIYSTNIRTEYFKHAAHSPFFFPLFLNAVYFIMLPLLVPVLFTF